MDGQESQWTAGWEYLPPEPAEVTDILDLLLAIGYLWEAAHQFTHPGDRPTPVSTQHRDRASAA